VSSRFGKAHSYFAEYFENQVERQYGYDVSFFRKAKSIDKFGRSELAGTAISTVWSQGGNETFLTDNTITKLTSSVASTMSISVEGHTIDGNGDFTFVVQHVTLNGTSDVALPTPLARCSRLANTGSVVLTGTVAARTAGDVIYCEIPAGQQQSFKAATTISKDDVFAIDAVKLGVSQKAARTAEFQIEVREKGGVFLPKELFVAASPGPSTIATFEPWLVVPANSDIRVRCIASANSTAVAASFSGVLASIL
jgi:hypothetical protein